MTTRLRKVFDFSLAFPPPPFPLLAFHLIHWCPDQFYYLTGYIKLGVAQPIAHSPLGPFGNDTFTAGLPTYNSRGRQRPSGHMEENNKYAHYLSLTSRLAASNGRLPLKASPDVRCYLTTVTVLIPTKLPS